MWSLAYSTLNIRLTKPALSPKNLSKCIKAEAKRLGFAFCGVALPKTHGAFDRYQAWLDEGLHAEMTYLARPDAVAKRQNLENLLPGCKSVLCLAMAYPHGKIADNEGENLDGRVASFACFADYHVTIREKLQALADAIEMIVGQQINGYIAVDSSPVLEKSFALKAGLGLIGKNTLLWNPSFGTWFFLGELLLDIALEPDDPMQGDFCGDCDICVRACPTGALCGDKRMDAARCLSYLTIEHRGAFPQEYRRAMGRQVFGCDICQKVCPKNAQGLPADFHPDLVPVLDAKFDLLEALSLSKDAFKARYAGTSLLRAKYQGFRRNVIIALGNSGSQAALQALNTALNTEEDPVCHESMLWAIENLSKMTCLKA